MHPEYSIPVDGRVLLKLLLRQILWDQELGLVAWRTAVTENEGFLSSNERKKKKKEEELSAFGSLLTFTETRVYMCVYGWYHKWRPKTICFLKDAEIALHFLTGLALLLLRLFFIEKWAISWLFFFFFALTLWLDCCFKIRKRSRVLWKN